MSQHGLSSGSQKSGKLNDWLSEDVTFTSWSTVKSGNHHGDRLTMWALLIVYWSSEPVFSKLIWYVLFCFDFVIGMFKFTVRHRIFFKAFQSKHTKWCSYIAGLTIAHFVLFANKTGSGKAVKLFSVNFGNKSFGFSWKWSGARWSMKYFLYRDH